MQHVEGNLSPGFILTSIGVNAHTSAFVLKDTPPDLEVLSFLLLPELQKELCQGLRAWLCPLIVKVIRGLMRGWLFRWMVGSNYFAILLLLIIYLFIMNMFTDFSIISWNVRGGAKKIRKRHCKELVRYSPPLSCWKRMPIF